MYCPGLDFFRILAHCGDCNIACSSIRSIVLWQKGPLIYVQFHVEHDVKHMGPFCLLCTGKRYYVCIYPEAANFFTGKIFQSDRPEAAAAAVVIVG